MREAPELFDAPENFLQAMLAAQRAEGTFTDREIVGNVFTLLIAGEDTTSHSLAWTSWFLAQHPEIQERCAQEAREVFGEEGVPGDHELVGQLPYAEAVLRESMRLKAVANGATVEPLVETTICDTRIPAGTRLILEFRHVGSREHGAAFDPERWLAPDAPDGKSFLTFGAGPRFCPGRNLAFLEAKTALALLTRDFVLNLDETKGPVRERLAFTTIPVGLRIHLRERAARAGADRPGPAPG